MLTPTQLLTLKTDILADPTLAPLFASLAGDNEQKIVDAYTALAAPAFFVWSTAVDVGAILDAINWANFTPNDTPTQVTQLAAQQWENRSMVCQIKQINLQMILGGRTTINASRNNVRSGITDALTALPTGNNGNAKDGGTVAVQAVLSRKATRLEKLFANITNGDGSAVTTPATLVVEGGIDVHDVENAHNS